MIFFLSTLIENRKETCLSGFCTLGETSCTQIGDEEAHIVKIPYKNCSITRQALPKIKLHSHPLMENFLIYNKLVLISGLLYQHSLIISSHSNIETIITVLLEARVRSYMAVDINNIHPTVTLPSRLSMALTNKQLVKIVMYTPDVILTDRMSNQGMNTVHQRAPADCQTSQTCSTSVTNHLMNGVHHI